jgi:SAM-dependent methyltransferase
MIASAEELFYRVFESMPRQGPGSVETTQKALDIIKKNRDYIDVIADIGCGSGGQTDVLLEQTNAQIIAIDNHQPFLDQLKGRNKAYGSRLYTLCEDMANLSVAPASCDVIWSEGAIYNIGFKHGLRSWQSFLKPGGFIAASEVVYLSDSQPEELRQFWENEYAEIDTIPNKIKAAEETGLRVIDAFVQPQSDWLEHFYEPMKKVLQSFRESPVKEPNIAVTAALLEEEIKIYEQYSDQFSYAFLIMKKV